MNLNFDVEENGYDYKQLGKSDVAGRNQMKPSSESTNDRQNLSIVSKDQTTIDQLHDKTVNFSPDVHDDGNSRSVLMNA